MPTTSDYLTQLQQDRLDLIDNLEAQGIDDLTGNETFTELVPRVLDIQTGGGKEKTYLIKDGVVQIPYTYTKAGGDGSGSFIENYNNEGYAYATAKTWSEYRLYFDQYPVEGGTKIGINFKKDRAWTGQYSQYGGGSFSLSNSNNTITSTQFVATNQSKPYTTEYLDVSTNYNNFFITIMNLSYGSDYSDYGISIYDLWIE